jgi:hypothetical protein
MPPLPDDPIQAAADLAARADVAIVVAGLTREWEAKVSTGPICAWSGSKTS